MYVCKMLGRGLSLSTLSIKLKFVREIGFKETLQGVNLKPKFVRAIGFKETF